MKFSVIKNALVPADDATREILLNDWQIGDVVALESVYARNQAFQGFVHIVIGKVATLTGMDADDVKALLLFETGYWRTLRSLKGKFFVVVKSTAPRAMTQKEFGEWWDAARSIMLDDWLPTLPASDAKAEIETMLKDKQ